MKKKLKEDIAEMVATAKFLAEKDPPSLLLAKSNIDILKARCDLVEKMKADPEKEAV